MAETLSFKNFTEFKDYNIDYLYKNFTSNFYLIKMIEAVDEDKVRVYTAYNITDTDGSNIIAMWVENSYLLFGEKWNDDILDELSKKIELQKFKRFLFSGSKNLILSFFKYNNTEFTVFKDRLIYECSSLSKEFKATNGELSMADQRDSKTLTEMSFQYSSEEYHGEGRTYEHMQNVVMHGIAASNFFVWKIDNNICSIAQVIYNDGGYPIIGHLFTNLDQRNKGCASSILYEITNGLLNAGHEACGLVSDITNPASNKVFKKIGYKVVGEYISLSKE